MKVVAGWDQKTTGDDYSGKSARLDLILPTLVTIITMSDHPSNEN